MADAANISIRRLLANELAVYRTIRLEALRNDPSSFASTTEDWLRLSDDEWLARMADAVFVAFEGNEPVGMMGLTRQIPSKMKHRATLVGVYLRKSLRGSGVATRLLDAVCDHAKSIGIAQLELAVSANATPSLRFYQSRGFKVFGRISHGLRDDLGAVDEIMMAASL